MEFLEIIPQSENGNRRFHDQDQVVNTINRQSCPAGPKRELSRNREKLSPHINFDQEGKKVSLKHTRTIPILESKRH